MHGIAESEAMADAADEARPTAVTHCEVEFSRSDLAAAWGLAMRTAVAHHDPALDPPAADPEPLIDDIDERVHDVEPELDAPIERPVSPVASEPSSEAAAPRPKVWRTPAAVLVGLSLAAFLIVHNVVVAGASGFVGGLAFVGLVVTLEPRRMTRKAIALRFAGALAVTLVAATIAGTVVHTGDDGTAPTPNTIARMDPDASIVATRCSNNADLGFFLGSLTYKGKEVAPFRVDVTFKGATGLPIGETSKRIDFIAPGGTQPLDITGTVSDEVASCQAIAVRLPRDS